MITETDFGLTPDQLAYIRARAELAAWRKLGPKMLLALTKAESALLTACGPGVETALESVRAAIEAAE